MSCVHARVGSFEAITRVGHMGVGFGKFISVHLRSPGFTDPQNQWISLGGCCRGYLPHFERNAVKPRCEKVVKFSLGKVPIFDVFYCFFQTHQLA